VTPCSDTADKSLSAKTGVAESPAWMLHKWKKKHGRPSSPFLLQEAIEGVEFAVGGWFGPAGFSDDGYEENHEHKKLFAGDLGPNCGEAGTVMRYVRRSKLADKMLTPLEEPLDRLGYVGNIDVNCIIDSSGHPWPLEFTVRCGYPAFNIELSMMQCDPCEFLMALACGESTKGAHRMNEPAVGVVMALPPYPNPPKDYDEIVGVPLYGELGEGWHSCEMQAGKDGAEQASAGGYLGVATGTGDTVRQAARRAYRVLDHLSMPASPFWRDDIGERLKDDIPKLQAHGFAVGMEY
jgi:phosphoribosylamine--glycine ligase